MHCSADLTEERDAADSDDDGVWDRAEATLGDSGGESADTGGSVPGGGASQSGTADPDAGTAEEADLLDPDGVVDDTLTVLVGIVGGIVVGAVGTLVLIALTGSAWGVGFGLLAWLAATVYLVRRRTVQAAVSRSAYAVSLVLLLVPVIALSPLMNDGLGERGGLLVALLVFVAVPAGIAAAIGWLASRFVPEDVGTP
jgi:hypothetical protein